METGALTGYIDVAQVVFTAFWIFFAGLIIYLRREDKREGYPLESDRSANIRVQGFPAMPAPKTFELADGRVVHAPRKEAPAGAGNSQPTAPWPGAPIEPTGDPMLAGVGPGTAAVRPEQPELAANGKPKIQPMRVATAYSIASQDPNPIGMPVIGADGATAATVVDAWIDIEEPQIRYLEAELPGGGSRVLIPRALARISGGEESVFVRSLLASQFANIPPIAGNDRVTQNEEEKVVAYFGAGQMYATPERGEPLI